MSSKIEQAIDEIQAYIDSCKPQKFSSSNIIVNKEQIEELIAELQRKTPEEIRRYQKIISNKEAILADAQAKAESLIAKAQVKNDKLVSEHQIMQQAYEQANNVVVYATEQAQKIMNDATIEANSVRLSAMEYTYTTLKDIETSLTTSMEQAKAIHELYIRSMQNFLDVISANCAQLNPMDEEVIGGELREQVEAQAQKAEAEQEQEQQQTPEELPNVEISSQTE